MGLYNITELGNPYKTFKATDGTLHYQLLDFYSTTEDYVAALREIADLVEAQIQKPLESKEKQNET